MTRPNILLLMTDQHRWDALGCQSDWVNTPNLDRIAERGVRFTHAYTNSPVCIPARVSMATGRYPHNTGVWGNQNGYTLDPATPMWTQSLKSAGYATSVFGKTHLHPHSGDLRSREHIVRGYGFDHVDEIAGPRATLATKSHMTDQWDEAGVHAAYRKDLNQRFRDKPWVSRPSPVPLELYADTYVGQQAKKHLASYDGDDPWFCWVSFGGPHEPWDAPEPYASMYPPDSMPPPVTADLQEGKRPQGLLDKRLKNAPDFADGEVAALRTNYAGNVTLIDHQVGEILRVIEERGELDNTVIALVSDHGEMNGDYGLLYKQNFLASAVRVPFVVSAPGRARGAVTNTPVELMDIGPTLVELAGAAPQSESFARSVVPTLTDPGVRHRHFAMSEFQGEIMVATDRYKACLNRNSRVYLLFDLVEDPLETRNLAGREEYAEVETRLRLLALQRLVRSAR